MLCYTGFAQQWHYTFDAAQKQAASENKNILLVFSGSDWCGKCMELERIVWQSHEFKNEAEKRWVLLRADFPQKKGMPEPVDINAENIVLAEKYNRNGFFPYIVLLDKNGRILGKTGYEEFENAKEYLFLLKNL